MNEALLARIDSALAQIEPMASHSFGPALSIRRQLRWCRDFVCGVTRESMPGALTMGLIAVREFDMYGDRPELASLINDVQRLVEEEMRRVRLGRFNTASHCPGIRTINVDELFIFIVQLVLSLRMGVVLTCAIAVATVLNYAFAGLSRWVGISIIVIGFVAGLYWEFRCRRSGRDPS
jgi:hypothetical protein